MELGLCVSRIHAAYAPLKASTLTSLLQRARTDSVVPSLLLTFYVNKRQTDRTHRCSAFCIDRGGGMRVGVVIKPQRRSCFGQYPKRANTSCKIRDTPMMECGGILQAHLEHGWHTMWSMPYLESISLCSWPDSFVCNVY
jgi:hypothetical protein